MKFEIEALAFVRGGRREPLDDGWDSERARIELAEGFGEEALAGLAAFSHAEIVFVFHRVAPEKVERGARHPRERADWPRVGVFAQRGRSRPNRLGVSVCRIEAVEGRSLIVRGLDAIDGTPVVDIKPVMAGFLPRGEVRAPDWAAELMSGYWTAPGSDDGAEPYASGKGSRP